MGVLVDSCIWLDIATQDPDWGSWSSQQVQRLAECDEICMNQIIYSEISIGYQRIEELDAALPSGSVRRLDLPWTAAFLAGKCFVQYRRRGGLRSSPLPDFFIGAHAAVAGLRLLTRDSARFETYFPTVKLIRPK